jgi:RNA polymerase sigma factor (sigma-70 family)
MLFSLDGEGFQKMYRRFRTPIFKYVFLKVRDAETAEEITQEVFLKAFRARDSYEPRFGFTTWLWTIAKNTVCDWHRRGDRDTASSEETLYEELPCPAPTAEALLENHGRKHELLRRMASLTELQKQVLKLRILHRLPFTEIARQLGVSLSAAKSLFYRARVALVEGMGPVGPFSPVFA